MIGVIADDVTGATDVAVAFRRRGLRATIHFGTPDPSEIRPGLDAAVIALKSRTIPAPIAVKQSLEAAEQLLSAGATQLYFKYCSTFDSTPAGNIGPVLDALANRVSTDLVVTTPSSPEHGRTTYSGYLFVHGLLVSESHMRNHPLTPMRDSSLVRLMDAQSAGGSRVIDHALVRQGAAVVSAHIEEMRGDARYVFPDAITDDDLFTIARSLHDAPLAAGAAGLASALAGVRAEQRGITAASAQQLPPSGSAAVLAGSCSRRTLEQIEHMISADRPSYRLDALQSPDPAALARGALDWYDRLAGDAAPLIYSSLPPEALRGVQARLGAERSAEILEDAIARVAQGLRARGVRRLIVAGGETSGAVINALDIRQGTVGLEAAPGVPWISTEQNVDVLLKSGNFGEPELLVSASA